MIRGLTAAQIIDLWESAQGRDSTGQALSVLAAATGSPTAALAEMSVGQRDELLLDIRRSVFGEEIRALVSCPACAEPLEFTAPADRFQTGGPHDAIASVEVGTIRARIRPPTSADLLAIRVERDVGIARNALLARCAESIERAGKPIPFEDLDDAEATQLARAAGEEMAEILLELACAACGAAWQSPFDIASYLWAEIAAFAARLLPEVHTIASAYGWSEREILELSPLRRSRYLDLIEGGV